MAQRVLFPGSHCLVSQTIDKQLVIGACKTRFPDANKHITPPTIIKTVSVDGKVTQIVHQIPSEATSRNVIAGL